MSGRSFTRTVSVSISCNEEGLGDVVSGPVQRFSNDLFEIGEQVKLPQDSNETQGAYATRLLDHIEERLSGYEQLRLRVLLYIEG